MKLRCERCGAVHYSERIESGIECRSVDTDGAPCGGTIIGDDSPDELLYRFQQESSPSTVSSMPTKKKTTLSPEALEQFREWGRQGAKLGASAGGKARAKSLGRKGMSTAMAAARAQLAENRAKRAAK